MVGESAKILYHCITCLNAYKNAHKGLDYITSSAQSIAIKYAYIAASSSSSMRPIFFHGMFSLSV